MEVVVVPIMFMLIPVCMVVFMLQTIPVKVGVRMQIIVMITMMVIPVTSFVPISVGMHVMFPSVEICILNIVMLDAMVRLRLNIVEQLIVLMLNIFNDFLPMVEFDIMWIIILVVLLIQIVMVKTAMVLFPVSVSFVVTIGMMSYKWLVNCVVRVEVSVVLNAMDVMVNICVPWMELVSVGVVIEGTVVWTFNIMVGAMKVVVVHILVHIVVHILVHIMVDIVELHWMLIVMLFMMDNIVTDMGRMINVMMLLFGSHFMVDVVDLMWKFVIFVSIMVVLMINHTALNNFVTMVFMPIVILILDIRV